MARARARVFGGALIHLTLDNRSLMLVRGFSSDELNVPICCAPLPIEAVFDGVMDFDFPRTTG